MPSPQGNQDVERVTGELEGNVDGEELNAAHEEHHAEGAGREEEVELGMVPLLDATQLGAEADNQEKTCGEEELENLGEEINPVSLEKECPLEPHRGQGHDDPD